MKLVHELQKLQEKLDSDLSNLQSEFTAFEEKHKLILIEKANEFKKREEILISQFKDNHSDVIQRADKKLAELIN